MEKIKAIIFDWAGTTVDYGCFAPVNAFMSIFNNRGVKLTPQEVRGPMGMLKIDHISELCKLESVRKQWMAIYGTLPTQRDVEELYQEFEPTLFSTLHNFAVPNPYVVETVKILKDKGLLIGSTTGYTKEMMEIVAKEAKKNGYAPDYLITSSEVKQGRPFPYMCERNQEFFDVKNPMFCVKVGDTVVDIKEGKNAGMWAVGIIMGSSELGVSFDEANELSAEELQNLKKKVIAKYKAAGADYIIEDIRELPKVIEEIDKKIHCGV